MEAKDSELLLEFKNKLAVYNKMEVEVARLLKDIVAENHFFVMDIQHRTKEPDSLEGKLERKGGKYSSLNEITDLCGFRIICYFSDTVDKIAEALDKVLVTDQKNSVDKRVTLQATQFGYLSMHCICSLPDDEKYAPEIRGIPFEIQIRTVLQHAWAEIEHDLGYKSDFGVPKPIRRDFSRIAGLLELADQQFLMIRENSKAYNQEVREKIANDKGEDILMDRVSLNEYFLRSKVFAAFKKRIKDELNLDIANIELGSLYVEQLEWLEIATIGDLYTLIDNNMEAVYNEIKNIVELYEIDIMSTGGILKYFCENQLIQENYTEQQIRKFLAIGNKDEKTIERNLKRILNKNNLK